MLHGTLYRNQAEGNRLRTQYTFAPRGLIYDRWQKPLVKNLPKFSLAIIPADLPREVGLRQQALEKISSSLDLPIDQLTELLKPIPPHSFQAIAIKENLDYEQALKLQISASDYPGVVLLNSAQRQYLYGNEFSHLLGYLSKISPTELKTKTQSYLYNDVVGKTGLESYYEQWLRGQYGEKETEIDASGQEKRILKEAPPQPGHSLVLTIDQELQTAAAKALKNRLTGLGKKRGVVIIQNPQTGEILSLVNFPTFDNNKFITGLTPTEYQQLITDPSHPLFFRALAGEYPSGSTIKPVIAAAALQEGIITDKTTFNSTGGLWITNQYFFPDWKAGGHGLTNVYKALAESVNTFFYILGGGYQDFIGLGPERIINYEKLFGFGQPTGLDLPGEADGFLPTADWKKRTFDQEWYIGDTYHIAIGQGDFLTTPLQLINSLAVFANGGKLYKPFLVQSLKNSDNQVIKQTSPQLIRQDFLKPEIVEIVRRGLRQTVTNGVAKMLQEVPMPVAGKTGTAQSGNNKSPHAWFMGFAPYQNPQISILVLIEEGGEGSAQAVPVAKEILNWWYYNRYLTKALTPTHP